MIPGGNRLMSALGAREERGAWNRAKLDAENPWPGLDAYGEDSTAFFKGREEEVTELMRRIRLSALTVVYGKSGLGKTSLLEAGLFPLLRADHYLPVYLRIDFSGGLRGQPLKQVMQRMKAALEDVQAEFPEPGPKESLWEYLHRKKPEIWSADNYPLSPVLVFDQFEELFSRSGGDAELIKQVFDDLADLIENRIPSELAGAGAGERRSRLDLFSQPYRIVLSFREDFLPEMRTWEKQVPSLLRSYLRLEPMSRARAIKAVEEVGKAVLDEGIAAQIVDFVGEPDHPAAGTSEMVIEPVLLSLCCTQLNRGRPPGAKIDKALLARAGEGILEEFYRGALEDEEVKGPPEVGVFIEDKLIQGGFRGDYPKQEALDKHKLTERQLAALTDRLRLLRIVPHADTARIELIHDRLVPVISKARDERMIRERQEEKERKATEAEAERDKERARSEELSRSLKIATRNRNIAIVAAVASCIVLAFGWYEAKGKERATLSAAVGVDTARLAEGRLALGVGGEPLEQAMYRGLAAYRLTGQGMSHARAGSLTTLHWVLEHSDHLRKALTINRLVPTPALSYSPDGKVLAVGGVDGKIRLLNGETYRELDKLDCNPPSNEYVWTLSFSSGGERLAAGYAARSGETGSSLVCVFDLAKHSFKKWSGVEHGGKPADVFSVAYGGKAGQEFVIYGGSAGMLHLLDIQTWKIREGPLQKGGVAVAVSADGRLVASGGEDKVIHIWNLDDLRGSNPKPRHELTAHEGTIQGFEFSRDDPSRLVSAGEDGRIIVWDVNRGCRVQESKTQEAKFYGISISPNGQFVASASTDGNVRLFGISTSKDWPCIRQNAAGAASTIPKRQELDVVEDGTLTGHGGTVLAVAWNPDGTRLASTGQDGSVRIWGPANSSFSQAQLVLGTDAAPAFGITTKVAINTDGRKIAAGDNMGFLHVWDRPAESTEPVTKKATASWRAHLSAVRAVAYIQIGGRAVLVSGGEDGSLKRWDVANGNPIAPDMVDSAAPIRSIALSPDGKVLAAGSSDGVVRLWDAATGVRKQKFEKRKGAEENYELYAVGFSADGKHLAVGDDFSDVLIRDLEKGGEEHHLGGHNLRVKALSGGGKLWLVSAGQDGSVLEWEQSALSRPQVEGLKKQDDFKYRMGFRNLRKLTSMDVSKDGALIVTGGEDGQVQLWDGVEHVLLGDGFRGHTASIQSVAIAPDGSFFVTVDAAKILVWAGPGRWANMICSKLVWNMSNKQWRDWVSPKIPYMEQCPGLKTAPD